MEKIELTQLLIEKFNERNNSVKYNEGDITFSVGGVMLPDNKTEVTCDFHVGGNNKMHIIRFVIKLPVTAKGDYNTFQIIVNDLSSSITTGKYFLVGQGDKAVFCSSYDASFFNTKYEKMNVEKVMMFMFDSLLMEYSDILKKV